MTSVLLCEKLWGRADLRQSRQRSAFFVPGRGVVAVDVLETKPVTAQASDALAVLRQAREGGQYAQIVAAQSRFDWLIDQLPRPVRP
jgi:hypothetical protein